jgi:hypothetical protein
MLLFPMCVGLFLLAHPVRRRALLQPGFLLLVGITLIGLIPILVWNAGHGWVGFRHLSALAGLADTGKPPGPVVNPIAFAAYTAGQVGVLFGYWFIAWAAAVVTFAPWRNTDPATAFLWWTSVPVWVVFAVAAVKVPGQPNWPAAAYVSGLVLAVHWMTLLLTRPNRRFRSWTSGILMLTIVSGVAAGFLIRYPSLVRPGLAAVAGKPTADRPAPVRRFDPTCRLCGWRTLAGVVDSVRDRCGAESGEEPVVAADDWTRPGELGFYCRGRPQVYTFGPVVGDRHSQYDLWRPNPVTDAQAFRGRTFVYVGTKELPDAERVFDRVEPPVEVIASDGGVPVAAWKVWVFHGYRGVPSDLTGRRVRGY